MSMEEKFMQLYTEYADIVREHEKDTTAIKNVILKLDFNKSLMRHFDKIQFIIRSLIISMRFYVKDAGSKHTIHMLKCYEKLLDLAVDKNDIMRYLSIVNLFTSRNDLEDCLSVFMDPKLEKNVKILLHSCSLNFKKIAEQNATEKVDLKELYLSLSRAVLVFIRLETAMVSTACGSKRRFAETIFFLDKCIELEYFVTGHDSQQYLTCFETLKMFLSLLETEISFEKSLADLRKKLEFFLSSKIIRATLVMDTAVTLAEFVNATQKLLIESIDGNNLKDLFSFMYRIIEILRSTKCSKTFCIKCENNTGIHGIDSLTTIACSFYKKSIQENFCNDGITEIFAKIYSHKLMSLSLLVCEYARSAQTNAVVALNDIVGMCTTADKTAFVIPILHELLTTFRKTKLTEINFEYNEVFILRKLLDMLKINEDWKEMIRVGFLAIIFLIIQKGDASTTLHNLVYSTCLLQQTHKETIKFFTPCNYLSEKGEKFYNLRLPSNLDYIDISLIYLKLANLYITFPMDFNNKIIDQILKAAAIKPNPLKNLRFIFYTDNITYDCFHERIQTELKRVNKQELISESLERKLLIGAFRFAEYLSVLNANTTKYKHISISEEISRKQSSLFEEQNLNFEIIQYKMLLRVKRSFNDFLQYYFALKADDCARYHDEIQYLLVRTKLLARHFNLREYPTDALETYAILFKLAKLKNDEFGIITACSYFAENSREFESRFANDMDLSKMLEHCYTLLVNHLQNLSKLSLRKQNEIFYCLLNISLYYLSINRINDAKKLLQFVHLTIGPCEMVTKCSKHSKNDKTENTDENKMQYEAVRIKYYSVLFVMIIKYNQTSSFSLTNFAEFIMYYVRSKINMTADDTINVPNILFNTIPEIITCGLNRYDLNEIGESLLTVLLKFSIRMGLIRRSIKTLIMIGLVNLFAENFKGCEDKIGLLELIFLIDTPAPAESLQDKSIFNAVNEGMLTLNIADPIRKEGSTMTFLSPHKVIQDNQESYVCRYLLHHPSKCNCVICQTPLSNLFLFQISCLHMRSAYLNVSNERSSKFEYKEVHHYWAEKLKKSDLVKNDEFLLYSVRMLMWCGHHLWRNRVNVPEAEKFMRQSYEWLQKMPNYDGALEEDIQMQIENLQDIKSGKTDKIEAKILMMALNRKKNFDVSCDRLLSVYSSAKKISKVRNDVAQRRMDLIEITAGLKTNSSIPTFKIFNENESIATEIAKNSTKVNSGLSNGVKELHETKSQNKQLKKVSDENEVIFIDSSPEVIEIATDKKKSAPRRAQKENLTEQEIIDEKTIENPEQASSEMVTPRVTRSRRMKNSK